MFGIFLATCIALAILFAKAWIVWCFVRQRRVWFGVLFDKVSFGWRFVQQHAFCSALCSVSLVLFGVLFGEVQLVERFVR